MKIKFFITFFIFVSAFSGCYVDTTIAAQNERTLIKPAILVSPSSVDKTCNIEITGNAEHSFTLLLFDPEGNIVRNEMYDRNLFIFDRKELPSGLYLLKVVCRNITLTKKSSSISA